MTSESAIQSLCVPAGGEASIEVAFEVPSAAVVSYGLDRGRTATMSVPAGLSIVTIPAEGRFGRRSVFVSREAGSEPTLLRTALRDGTPRVIK